MLSVISVENLSKKYIIGHQKQERYTTLRDVLAEGAKRFTNKLIHPFAAPQDDPTHEEFWALLDVSFDIQQGDRVGIIGRNGAGKSTLLKILSRITEPTSGRVSIKGRVASLLEVGTGFHPELTGRENIFLNGAILGMSKSEIKKKFDEIVAFAEVERFLDTPVKRYSSGMYIRLAFAVAAHLEPEILIVDEVLAVGDVQFQKKCLGKMQEVGAEGRTVLFVSHNIKAIETLCSTCILLSKGTVVSAGMTEIVTDRYLSQFDSNVGQIDIDKKKLRLAHSQAEYSDANNGRYKINIALEFEVTADVEEMYIDFGLENKNDVRLFQIIPAAREVRPNFFSSGTRFTYFIDFETVDLAPGEYYCTIYAHSKMDGPYLLQSHIPLFKMLAREKNKECMSAGFSAVLLPEYKTKILEV